MKISLHHSIAFLIVTLLTVGCGEAFEANSGEETVTISGQVINQANSQPVANAFVEISSPAEFQQSTTTNEGGEYTFTVQTGESVQLTIEVSAPDFEPLLRTVNVSPGADFPGTDLEITAVEDGGGDDGNGDGDDGVGGEPAGAAAIVLTNNPLSSINIAETGSVVSSPFTFQVQDSAGRALDTQNSVEVDFILVNSPGGGEDVVPSSVTTDASGSATTTLFSGNIAGAVKLQAVVERPDIGLTIRSSPVLIAIHGGFPDPEHFSIAVNQLNFEGFSINNARNTISVIVGDQFSNPVSPGTIVYFETTGGVIQGSGATDEDGLVEVDLISGDPRPTDSITGSGGRPGYATVTARTVDKDDNDLFKEVNVLFSTSAAIIEATPTTFDLAPNGGASFDYTVTDLNGNPMAPGTEIAIEAGEGIEVSGDANFTLGDNLFPGLGATQFSFSIRDTDDENNDPADLTIQISVTSPSGNTTTYSQIQGTRR
jgi:hypothetical protein